MSCVNCRSGRGCRCSVIGTGVVASSGVGTGADPRVLSATCVDIMACAGSMFTDVGLVYDPGTGLFTPPPGTPATYVLKANGDGTASWVAP